jgi:predicted RNase H-like nuclease
MTRTLDQMTDEIESLLAGLPEGQALDVLRSVTKRLAAQLQPSGPIVAGLDGCRGGWVLATTAVDDGSPVSVTKITSISELLDRESVVAAGIDIPIGLPDSGPRPCDVEARAMLGPRRSSVFPAPIRPLLPLTTWAEANALSRTLNGKGLSQQAFAIIDKIREVDSLITPELQNKVVEVHPEVCFAELAGRPMRHHKATAEGCTERLEVLRPEFSNLDHVVEVRLPGTQPDDVVDAVVAAWSARRFAAGKHRRLGGDTDGTGLRMEMII